MNEYYNGFLFSDKKELLQLNKIYDMLSKTYWAYDRELNTIEKSIHYSLCFGIYKNYNQIGFARCVTDYSVIYWLCDVVIDENYRNQGLGKKLIQYIVQHDELKDLRGILTSSPKHQALYSQFGFESKTSFMFKPNK